MNGNSCLSCGGIISVKNREERVRFWSRALARPAVYPRMYRLMERLALCSHCLEEWPVIGDRICCGCGKDLDRDVARLFRKERGGPQLYEAVGAGGQTNAKTNLPPGTDSLCQDCKVLREKETVPSVLLSNRGLLHYEKQGKAMLSRFKYRGDERLAAFFATLLAIGYYRSYADRSFWCLSEVPLHQSRLTERGFNQMELVAKELSGIIGVPYVPLLVRAKETTKLSQQRGRKERENSMSGAFSLIHPGSRSGRDTCAILLIDDIYTTGSTLRACAASIREGLGTGHHVYGLTCYR
ncbi:ComF family protein [Brevibacillus ruminantium]|uniref:ComF family protein n=1 Tax=Brevibacillus ruminantium TaxID=2950604 RepID=A0ABY4WEL7_9BACL|nr:ComF family protein [Brevibacillus ruminantium]USG65334.1 ComF family protein [Brevibacillus ruminantium]